MKIAIGSDHRGFKLKERVKEHLDASEYEYQDFGTYSADPVDYPDYGFRVAEAVSRGDFERGILICGTGLGMTCVANKVPGIIAALCTSPSMAEMSRRHNNSNVLVLAGDMTSEKEAVEMVGIWLKTEFESGRHKRRVDKILEYEKHQNAGRK